MTIRLIQMQVYFLDLITNAQNLDLVGSYVNSRKIFIRNPYTYIYTQLILDLKVTRAYMCDNKKG